MEGKAVITYYEGFDVVCSRCKTEPATVCARLDSYCTPCFVRFIRGKQRKLMKGEQFKAKHASKQSLGEPQKVLLAFSGGVSSVVLFDVLASNLEEQMANKGTRGQQGFELIVVNLDETIVKSIDKKVRSIIKDLISLYPTVSIQYLILPLHAFVADKSSLAKLSLTSEFGVKLQDIDTAAAAATTFESLLLTVSSKSAVEDLLAVVQSQLLLQTAYQEKCQTLVMGHNTTRLANEIISLTVKGRGGIIHKDIADHKEHFKDTQIEILYPLRGVLQAEIDAYAKLTGLDVHVAKYTEIKSRVNKNLTVNDLSTQYFRTLDLLGYGNTASTVLKSGEKLGEPRGTAISHCRMCGEDIRLPPRTWLNNITTNEGVPLETEEELRNLEAFNREYPSISNGVQDNSAAAGVGVVDVCYGCTLSLQAAKPTLVWPVRHNEKDIINEYVLTDNEEDEV
ncbi:cytoplasmic tRNA 2-thiolation protein 2 [Scheffersomyces spartinae]|uniref:Cytoplasmic tRNA 2-thiolation protein 2 n=1 Tax=Scheffersomyces spartinae TaxID=45513 RepID=A0A9P7VCA7_9ASCO|nr:cytoplasmic tRNA 2-thiolation protein 2 [Scheffersomyces spartinae]KAG7195252.1 cytoplasmic tRNA 2-thiolation protein 2 [Scheffersomyces spartinae]